MAVKEAIAKCLANLEEIDADHKFGGVFQVVGEKDGAHVTVWCGPLTKSHYLCIWIALPGNLRAEVQIRVPDRGRPLGETAKQHAPALIPLAVEAARVAGIEVEA